MTVYRKPFCADPVGDVDGPDESGQYWTREFGSNERGGPFSNSDTARNSLVYAAGVSAGFYVDGGPQLRLQ